MSWADLRNKTRRRAISGCHVPALIVATFLGPGRAFAVDLQGRGAHEGTVEEDPSGAARSFDVSGHLGLGVSLYNPTYGARPDNSGLALFRYEGHADVDLIGRKLSIPVDLNVWTDGTQKGLRVFRPTEVDAIAGLTSAWRAGPGEFEMGSRFEQDSPVDRGGFNQRSFDTRLRYLFSIKRAWPGLANALHGGDIEGWATLGWFGGNVSYPARPDNSGLALFRYQLRTELSMLDEHLGIGFDETLFTDRTASDLIGPSELDFTAEILSAWRSFEFHVAYERDLPVDRGTYTETFIYALVEWEFDLFGRQDRWLESSEPTSRHH